MGILYNTNNRIVYIFQEKTPVFFDRLHEALQLTSEFFYADGRGLAGTKLYCDTFSRLSTEFFLNGVSTLLSIDIKITCRHAF